MTRLTNSDIDHIGSGLPAYDRQLQAITGVSLLELACRAVGRDAVALSSRIGDCLVFALPMSCGGGIITNFSETLCAIASHLGFRAQVTRQSDSAGLAEAYEKKADIIITADDNRFVALHTGKRLVVDNARATGKGFVTGLAYMAGSLRDRSLLVIGCGPVGRNAALAAAQLGAIVTLFDINREQCQIFAEKHQSNDFRIAESLASALDTNDLIVEATPAENVIDLASLGTSVLIAAPGVPCGVSPGGRQTQSARLLWDPLQIGVATMLMEAVVHE